MANKACREKFRGVEGETLDFLFEVITPYQWGMLLKDPLLRAVADGNRDLVHKLVAAGAELGNALHEAVHLGYEDIVNELLTNGAALNGENALERCQAFDDQLGDTRRMAPLHVAVEAGNMAMVELLLLKGADEDVLDTKHCTPLSLADCCGRLDIMRVLIEHGADANHAGAYSQRSVLHVAAYSSTVGAIDVLVEAGAYIEPRDSTGATPLHYAAEVFSFEAAAALLDHGADINARGLKQSTPLHYAATMAGAEDAADMVDFLLRSGADETVVDDDGKSAVDVIGQRFELEDGACYEDGSEVEIEDLELVRDLLVYAAADRADRARRLRIYLVLCRAHPDRVQQVQKSSSGHVGAGRGARGVAMLPGAEGGRGDGAVGGRTMGRRTGVDCEDVVARVVRLPEEGIFRTIMWYL